MKTIRTNIILGLTILYAASLGILPYCYHLHDQTTKNNIDLSLIYTLHNKNVNDLSAYKLGSSIDFTFKAEKEGNMLTILDGPTITKTQAFIKMILKNEYTLNDGDYKLCDITVKERAFRVCIKLYSKENKTFIQGTGVDIVKATKSVQQLAHILSAFALFILCTVIIVYIRFTDITITPIKRITAEITKLQFGSSLPPLRGLKASEFHPLIDSLTNQSKTIGNVMRELRHRVRVVHANEKTAVQSQARWETAFNSLKDIMIIFDKDFFIQDINQAGVALLETSKSEIIGKRCHCGIFKKQKCNTCWLDSDLSFEDRSGRITEIESRSFLIISSKVCDEQGNIIQVIDILRDITEIKEAELTLLKAKNTIESHDKLKSEFLNNISHELRTPLNGIIGASEILRDTELEPEQKELLSLAYSSGISLEKLIDRIIMFTQLLDEEKSSAQETPLLDLTSHAHEAVSTIAQSKGLFFSVNVDPLLPSTLYIDPSTVKVILDELIDNAVKFTDNGYINIQLRRSKAENNTDNLHILIEDTGIGIQNTDRDIFSSFVQADGSTTRSFNGLGLGLSIVNEALSKIDGSISITNALNGGTSASVYLPYTSTSNTTIETKSRII